MTANRQAHDAASGGRTHFGFSSVDLDAKQTLVDDVFHKVARRYDIMNDLMSGGLHRAWKADMVAALAPSPHRALRVLDVAGGTGDVAFRTLAAGGQRTRVTVLDINGEMLTVGRERAGGRFGERIDFVQANAEALPFPEGSFDAYTIAFGIRNVPRLEVALAEAFRVLRRGGRFLCLEFSHVDLPGLDRVYDAYSFHVIPALGRLVTGEAEPYRYLVESIRRFPNASLFTRMIEGAGFGRVTARSMTGGIVALHSAWKI
ncbi:bifunctional demethylmenaquinone methyltransferase/2-methoxy-6-polyprenyl-1,4-benzoquinol methylase UbiE [Chelatococcus reniformis]|uniref:Ubiquinone/menaquinone biosynthesis C-methyltransferase UbiE n=1 Tax=Chelatococcus reniformis TaxID=1494448 RepID=A0A916XEF4_9HYPH|nr:bifunctional demethylmenaquinone methyltransferase/2-methoxy-6-polyprenyl-1,4-benzoquinol methylase UbiE [Chelatococcus reniformis]GGC65778.1 ubiquinone/menaquinone biosynthesis C-methyltransferase UbiE [Chelatococcus reniformis]